MRTFKIFFKNFFKIKKGRKQLMKNKFHEKNIAGLGIEPQNCKMSCIETWCLSPLDHEISIKMGFNYQYINTVIRM